MFTVVPYSFVGVVWGIFLVDLISYGLFFLVFGG
jgi:hypothetical protein